ncbi:MAG: 6,7-dimethyl-8-ribityllumazine synthase [Bacteroidia bacterium]
MSKGHDLSHIRYTGTAYHGTTRVAIVVSKWNDTITEALFEGASSVLRAAGIPSSNIQRYDVPGSYELPLGAQIALNKNPGLHGVITLGCIIQGETRHFDFIAQAVADGLMRLNLDSGKPVIFGVLTPDTDQQAADRAGGKYGNKGEEAAVALLEMVDLSK